MFRCFYLRKKKKVSKKQKEKTITKRLEKKNIENRTTNYLSLKKENESNIMNESHNSYNTVHTMEIYQSEEKDQSQVSRLLVKNSWIDSTFEQYFFSSINSTIKNNNLDELTCTEVNENGKINNTSNIKN